MIRNAEHKDAENIAGIYNHYIENTVVTFEENTLVAEDIRARLADTASDKLPWLVIEEDEEILGYAYASKWKGRCAYRYSAEVTVYLAPSATGRGFGARLYTALFEELRQRNYHIALGGIALPNAASVALHEKFGMKKVGHFEEVGYKFGRWVDVGYWQARLDGDQSQ